MISFGVRSLDMSRMHAYTISDGSDENMDTKSTTATRFHDKISEEVETPPSCPRQPPDGDEAPPIPTEVPPMQSNQKWLSASTLPKTTRKIFSRSQDARSECSVKDKIAMFSNKKSTSIEKLDKFVSKYPVPAFRPEIQNGHSNSPINKLDKRFAQSTDSLDTVSTRYSLGSREKRPEVVGGAGSRHTYKSTSSKSIEKTEFDKSLWIDKDPKETLSRNTSRKSSYSRSESSESHKSTLDYLIEQRKKSMSKLRTLMIPDSKPICDLPEIKVQESKLDDFKLRKQINSYSQEKNNITSAKITSWTTAIPNIVPKYSPAFKRKSLQLFSAVPLSKEYKSKHEISVANENKTENRKINSESKSRAPSKPPRTSLENKKFYLSHMLNPRNNYTSNQVTSNYSPNRKNPSDISIHKLGHKGDIIDSDNDSAVSSTQSSYRSSPSSPSLPNIDSVESDSSHCSLRSSDHLDNSSINNSKHKDIINTEKTIKEYKKRNITRSLSSDTNTSIASSGGSVLTSGSQASCSSIESGVPETYRQKMSKNKSIEAINRRNILASAKCRSGRDFKINSPVIESKFTHKQESLDTSHITKTPEKMSTLNVAVTKSDSCRRVRPKSIHETDSDSDSERINQRKYDFKTTRPRKTFYKQDQNRNENKPMDTLAESEIVLVSKGFTNTESANIRNVSQNVSLSNANKSKIEIKDAKTYIPSVASYNSNTNNTSTGACDRVKPNETNKENAVPDTPSHNTRVSQCDVEKTVTRNTDVVDNQINTVPASPTSDLSTGTVVRLVRGAGAGVGLILAGGVDCEAKNVTIHKILKGGPAEKDGRLHKGDRIISINNKCMEGLSHSESVVILKEPRNEVVLVVERNLEDTTVQAANEAEIISSLVSHPVNVSSNVLHVELVKSGAGAGLGIGLEGGKDSPNGDVPLLIKKLFTGGAAAKTGLIEVGAILEAVNGISVRNMTRTEAWNLLKSIPTGPVTLMIKLPVK